MILRSVQFINENTFLINSFFFWGGGCAGNGAQGHEHARRALCHRATPTANWFTKGVERTWKRKVFQFRLMVPSCPGWPPHRRSLRRHLTGTHSAQQNKHYFPFWFIPEQLGQVSAFLVLQLQNRKHKKGELDTKLQQCSKLDSTSVFFQPVFLKPFLLCVHVRACICSESALFFEVGNNAHPISGIPFIGKTPHMHLLGIWVGVWRERPDFLRAPHDLSMALFMHQLLTSVGAADQHPNSLYSENGEMSPLRG